VAALAALAVGWGAGCQRAPARLPGAWTAEERALIASLSPIPPPPPSPTNRFADDPAAARLGQALFFDRRLSADGQVACASCHVPSRAFTDGLPLARGVGTTGRHAPSVLGAAHLPFLFWDGRKDSLWSQALGPLESPVEHAIARTDVAHAVAARYREAYERIFGPLPALADRRRFPAGARPAAGAPDQGARAWAAMAEADRDAVDRVFANVGKALEAYQRLLQPQPGPFDAYVAALRAGDPSGGGHLSPAALAGLAAFIGSAGCVNCHNGPLFTDKGFHNLGLPRPPGASGLDVGRTLGAAQVREDPFSCGGRFADGEDCQELRFLDPRFEDFLGAFKTPSLRNVAETAPYLHDGRMASLREVLTFYRDRPGAAEIGHRDLILDTIAPDGVPVEALEAFLHTLSGDLPAAALRRPPGAPGGAP
jgi:cytochrome c peroxidase